MNTEASFGERERISTPTRQHLWEYLNYQFPATQGNIHLRQFCEQLALLEKEKVEEWTVRKRKEGVILCDVLDGEGKPVVELIFQTKAEAIRDRHNAPLPKREDDKVTNCPNPKRSSEADDAFLRRMSDELRANAGKGEWSEWHPSIDEAIRELWHHHAKLEHAIINFHALLPNRIDTIAEQSADLANICMKVFMEWGKPIDKAASASLPKGSAEKEDGEAGTRTPQ